MLEHGGRRRAAALRYGIAESDWLDLSTGINPRGYPVPALPAESWSRLPEDDDELAPVAARAYGCGEPLPVAGSQPAIQALPRLFSPRRVALLSPAYAEHRYHWQGAGHDIRPFVADQLEAAAADADVVVVCNPNNPDATVLPPQRLLAVAAVLQTRGGWLIVDEAFADAVPDSSVIAHAGAAAPHLVVLRSLGKFYGLAGARVGFVAAGPSLRDRLRESFGPWAIAGPARAVARVALADESWRAATRERLARDATRLGRLLGDVFAGAAPAVNPLFVWLATPRAATVADQLAKTGVLVRCFDDAAARGLRFGLPGDEADWARLAEALARIG